MCMFMFVYVRGHVCICVYVCGDQRMTLDIVPPQLLSICYIYSCDFCTMLSSLAHGLQRSDHFHLPRSQTHHSWLFSVGSGAWTQVFMFAQKVLWWVYHYSSQLRGLQQIKIGKILIMNSEIWQNRRLHVSVLLQKHFSNHE